MDAITLFKQAAQALQSDPRYLALDAARKANDADQALQQMIAEFGRLNSDYQEASVGEEADKERAFALQSQLNDLYGRIMANETMQNYSRAQQDAEKLIAYIDRIVTEAMNGGDPMTVQEEVSGCSGCCSSCGGCG